ncbi:MAG TPA: lysine exporter LysO family protein [Candidatus Treponema faecavium]|nr:lysine exporter LysO family protein [Candidatus Treponema faecavium]
MVILAVAALAAGVIYGLSGVNLSAVSALASHSDYILIALMFFVGISIGLHRGIAASIRRYHVRIFLIPAGIIAASIAGGVICSVITGYSIRESIAVTCGLGWYSLSGITVGNLAGPELGSVTFLSNLMREICAFFSIPWISRHLNYYACIGPAAATSEDTTLPMLIRYTNEETVVLSVFNGIICSAAVPALISCCYAFF